MKVFAHKNICRRAVEIVLIDQSHGRESVARPVNFIFDALEDGQIVEPTMAIRLEDAELLMQALWDAGFRPNNGAGSSAEADALRKHIAFAERVADRLLGTP